MSLPLAVNNAEAQELFDSVWKSVIKESGGDAPHFPKSVFWLNGAPGAGKGTNTAFIMEKKGFKAGPVVVSDLLQTPEVRKIMDSGMLVGDLEVMGLLFNKLREPQFAAGVIVDGFPRTQIQCDCLKLLFNKLSSLHSENLGVCPRPDFHILVLDVSEQVAVERQLKRGSEALAFNAQVDSGKKTGPKQEIRKTDTDAEAAAKRYRVFAQSTVAPLQSLRGVFAYHHIDAGGDLESVRESLSRSIS